jgi:hypothetical protein
MFATPIVLSVISPDTLKDPMFNILMGYASQAFSLFCHSSSVCGAMQKVKGTEWINLKSKTNLYAVLGMPSSFQSNKMVTFWGVVNKIINVATQKEKMTAPPLLMNNTVNTTNTTSPPVSTDSIPLNEYMSQKIKNITKNTKFANSPINITIEKAMNLLDANANADFGNDFLEITRNTTDTIQLNKDISYFLAKYNIS